MRQFMNILEAALLESKGGFVLDPALDPANYVMTESLRGVKNWKAMCYVGNNGDEHLGQLMDVGYIMISKTRNTIIPIARDDEHHMGSDLLYDLSSGQYPYRKKSKKLDINPTDYYPIWAYGNNYVYEKRELAQLLVVLTKYLSYGGTDGVLKGSNDLSGVQITLTDFVARNGDVSVTPGTLASLGKRVVEALSGLGTTIRAVPVGADPIMARKAFTDAVAVAKVLTPMAWELGLPMDELKALPARLKDLQKANDIKGLDMLFFGLPSIKSTIHIHLKKIVKGAADAKPNDFYPKSQLRAAEAFWGDVNLAIDMLARF